MKNRWLPFGLMFLVCFGGVFAALRLNDQIEKTEGPASLNALVETKPVQYPKAAGEIAFEAAVDKILPAVVSVDVFRATPFTEGAQLASQGSGVILTADGYIITNSHVIQSGNEIHVNLTNGKQYKAEVVGDDPITDLALLKVAATGLPAAELGDSDTATVGQWVLAIGNPLGYEGTLSVGVVSALNRDLPLGPESAALMGAIQTDAAINQGNSGGALGNIHGQVIGINSAIATPNRGSVGIGFAIPSNRVKKAVDEIRKYGRVRHPDLGVRVFKPPYFLRHPLFAEQVGPNPPKAGLVIDELISNSPLAVAGLKEWDVLTSIDGKALTALNDYLTFLFKAELGQKVKVDYWSRGDNKSTTVTLAEVVHRR
ncbi:MAG: trypsin-like peptidase domain-containing protein [Armatimonadota bacterium]|nr:trypsin-like peptidase domain-containing protein [Armatimonadota bacterium]